MNTKPGDLRGFIYAQPATMAYLRVIVKGVDGDHGRGSRHQPFFDVARSRRWSLRLWKASEEELDQGYQGTMYEGGRTTNRQLAAKARARFGFPVDRARNHAGLAPIVPLDKDERRKHSDATLRFSDTILRNFGALVAS